MRSDIAVRQESQWPSGIENFVGHLDYYGAANGVSGIVNNTKIPLFESIGSGGVVRGLTVYCDTNGLATVASLSPLCITNYGLIENCRVTSGSAVNGGLHFSITSATGGLAGLCVTNKGTIKASGCEARLYCANRRVSGICLVNDGLIQGCYTSTPMYIESASRASSICDSNSATGTIRESYHGAGIATEASMSWGGIAYSNSGAIQRCYASETGPINTSGSVGGIVNTNYGGTVNECYNEASLQGTAVGGLVAYMRSGRVVNCYCNDDLLVLTQKSSASTLYAGGLIGMMSGGTVENCYAILNQVEGHSANGVMGGLVGRLRTGTIRYCYVYESNSLGHSFYGTTDGGTLESTCYLVGGSQSGVSSVDATASGYNALYTALSAGAGTSGYNAWVQSAAGTLPVLQSITPAKKRARR